VNKEDTTRPNEETVVAVRPDLSPQQAAGAGRTRRKAPWLLVSAVVLAVPVLAVFFVLPRWVEQRAEEREAAAAVLAAARAAAQAIEPAAPTLSEAERAALEAQAESLLAALLPQQAELEKRVAASWGGEGWLSYQSVSRRGDDAFLAKDFAVAVAAYTESLDLGRDLLTQADDIVATALASAGSAVLAGEPEAALEQYDIVLSIEPDNTLAQGGRARAERLPEAIEFTQAGDDRRRAGDLDAARASYRAALSIDPDWSPASTALNAVTAEIAAARFDSLMSRGLSALAAEEYADAASHFRTALQERPGAEEAQDGLTAAEQGLQLDQIALAEARAIAFETRELWDRAIDQYRAALTTDATLAFANEGLERAQQRADLDVKLVNLIDNPDLLLRDEVLDDAQALAEQARALAVDGTRLASQVETLDRLLNLATTPIPVQLASDAQTQVTVYRVGELGAFMAMAIEVRPGTYTAVGSRRGYRDVRKTFTVLPGREPPEVSVVCVETI
jgi:hypothetical protein